MRLESPLEGNMTADKKSKKKPEVTICRNCKFYRCGVAMGGIPVSYACESESAPITHFVHGLKEAYKINADGCCAHYQAKALG